MSISSSLSELLAILIPDASSLRVDAVELDPATSTLTLTATATQPSSVCPTCQQAADRPHSRYTRCLADLPVAESPVRLQLQVRKFFCDQPTCPRRIFTERLPTVVAPWARRTTRLATQQRHLGLALGGAAGARLGAHLDLPASRNTFLHLIRTTPRPEQPPPRILGIDDWAQRKGHSYRTILVDLERHRPIDLLPDREAETIARWLQQHPGVDIIVRDRAGAYADGASRGAPDAIQVADRFHLLRNLHETLTRVFEQYAADLASLATEPGREPIVSGTSSSQPAGSVSAPEPVHVVPPVAPSLRARQAAEQRRARRLARYETVCQFHNRGWTVSAIAREIGLDRATVRTYVTAPAFPERHPRPQQASVLDPFKPYILQHWNAGCHTGAVIWRELEQRGYRGKRSTVFSYISRLRRAQGVPPKKRAVPAEGRVVDPGPRPATPRSLAWLVLRRPEKLEERDQQRIAALRQVHPGLDEAIRLTQEFAQVVRERGAERLDGWLDRASTSEVAPFRRFAGSLRRDYAAVYAGVALPWSTGPVEGHINRLKLIKRTMFGRAKLDLLQQRVVHAT